MKKNILTLLLVVVMLPSLVCVVYANEGYPVHSQQSLPESIIALLKGDDAIVMLDCDPANGTVDYVSWISYDYLSELSTKWESAGVIVYNSEMDAYFIRVSYIPTISTSDGIYEYCTLGTTNGYVYGAESVDSGTDEIVDLLSSIRRFLSNMYGYVWGTDEGIQGILGRLDGGYSSLLSTMNTHLENIETALGTGVGSLGYNVQRTLNYISGPLYNTLSSIDIALNDPDESLLLAKLDEIKTAIENINISADNITVEGYDDALLMELLNSFSPYWENIDLGIQSLNTALYVDSSTPLLQKINSIQKAIGYGAQGNSIFSGVSLISNYLYSIEDMLSRFLGSTSYDDTNVIAAVNSVETALSNLSFDVGDVTVAPADLTPVITSIDAIGLNIENLSANFNTSLSSLVDKLDVLVDNSAESVENLTVDISVDNDAYNVFYVTDEDGNEESIVDFSSDVLKAGGKLLNFLFRVCFDGAIENLDGSIDDMDSFYFDGAELGGSLWE